MTAASRREDGGEMESSSARSRTGNEAPGGGRWRWSSGTGKEVRGDGGRGRRGEEG